MASWKRDSGKDRTAGSDSRGRSPADFRGEKASRPRQGRTWLDPANPDQRGFWRRFKMLALVALIAALLLAWYRIVWLKPNPVPFIEVVVAGYQRPYPPNAFAEEDRIYRQELPDHITRTALDEPSGTFSEWPARLGRTLLSQQPGGPNNDVMVVYISAHGVLDGQGRPCLVLDSDSRTDSTWIALSSLLAEFDDPKLHDVKKLLILDCNRILDDWQIGVFHNGFAEVLKDAVETSEISNLYLLNSASAGQIAWTAPEAGYSVFGYFVAEGFRGAADGVLTGGKRDKRISLQELEQYVHSNVIRWVEDNRGIGAQDPFLVHSAKTTVDDFPLIYVSSEHEGIPLTPRPREDRLDAAVAKVAEAWTEHENLKQQRRHLARPALWAEAEQQLLRLEALMLAGKQYDGQFQSTLGEVHGLFEKLRGPNRADLPAASIPMAIRLGQLSTDAPQQWIDAISKLHDATTHKDSDAAVPNPIEFPAPVSAAEAVQATAAWLQRQETEITREHLATAVSVINSTVQPTAKAMPSLEACFFKMLYGNLNWHGIAENPPNLASYVRTAIESRRLAEQAATPLDDRAHYWVQRAVDEADADRRIAEDRLFVGETALLEDAEATWTRLNADSYPSAIGKAEDITAAYHLRDSLWAESVYLSQWVLKRVRDGANRSEADDLLNLIESGHKLSRTLDELNVAQVSVDAIALAVRDQEKILAGFQDDFQQHCKDLTTKGVDFDTLRRIGEALQLPLVTGRLRNQLRDKYLDMLFAARTVGVADGSPRDDNESGKQPALDANYLALLCELPRHPTLAILDVSISPWEGDDDGSRYRYLAAQGQNLREKLGGVTDEIGDQVRQSLEPDAAAQGEPRAMRRGFAEADLLARQALPLLGRNPWSDPDDDPTTRLESLDLHDLFLWHAWRIMEDYWGTPTHSESPTRSYFILADRKLLSAAAALYSAPVKLRYQGEDLDALLRLRTQIALQELDPRVGDDLRPNEDYTITLPRRAKRPDGIATMRLEDAAGNQLQIQIDQREQSRSALNLRTDADAQQVFRVQGDQLAERSQLKDVIWFRGHHGEATISVWQPTFPGDLDRGQTVEVLLPKLAAPGVTVRGEKHGDAYVTIIFDCSGSMSDTVQFDNIQSTRYKFALSKLMTVLENPEFPQEGYRFGLHVFGRQVGVDSGGNRVVQVPSTPRIERLAPGDDVEELLPLAARSTFEAVRMIRQRLESIEPKWGLTPLYLSIVEVLDKYRNLPPDTMRHIVVITDGVNHQGLRATKMTLAKNVLDKLHEPQLRDVRIDIVGFDLSTEHQKTIDNAKQIFATADLPSIRQNVRWIRANDPDELLRSLEELLTPPKFAVVPSDDAAAESTYHPITPIGTTVRVPHPVAKRLPYQIRVRGLDPQPDPSEIELEGGESLLLQLTRGGRLEHVRYDDEGRRMDRAQRNRSAPGAPASFTIAPHDPKNLGRNPDGKTSVVQFKASIENSDPRQFTPRPYHMWATITPVFDDRRDDVPKFRFCEASYLQGRHGTSIPVLLFRVPQWPNKAAKARIELWFNMQPNVKPVAYLDVEAKAPQAIGPVRYTVSRDEKGQSLSILVAEQHPAGADLDVHKLSIEPPPDKIIRTVLPEADRVEHKFIYFSRRDVANFEKSLAIIKRSDIQAGAVATRAGDPLEIEIPDLR